MARHGLHRRQSQFGDNTQPGASVFPSLIPAPTEGDANEPTLTFASSAAALTTITTTQEFIESVTGGSGFSTRTTVITSAITDPAAFAALTSAEARPTSTASRTSSSTPSASSSAASEKSSSNLSTLIPAIVVPIVVVLLASLGLFWFLMRKRHQREVKNADFVMAGKGEKLSSRTNSSRSATTGMTAAEKSAPVVIVSEFNPPTSSNGFGPKYSMEDIGVARPLTPKDGSGPGSPRAPSRDRYGVPATQRERPYQNFSGPRPDTARDRRPPPSHQPQGRSRSNSSPAKRAPPPSAFPRGPPPGRPSPEMRGGPSPVPRSGPGPSPIMTSGAFPSARSLPQNPRPAPAPPRPRDLSPTLDHSVRAAPPANLKAPPTGAFNGQSSISQYSPIVKETPKIGSGPLPGAIGLATLPSTSQPKSSDGSRAPPPLNTNNLTSTTTSRSMSPASPSGNFLTEENMRIARLANSSRLGFFNTSATSPSAEKGLGYGNANASQQKMTQLTAAATQSPATASNPSPKLPPPATRSQLIPNDSPQDDRKAPFNYFTNTSKPASPTSSFAPGPSKATGSKHHLRMSHTRDRDDDEVSDLGDYEDIDAKSDVSSMDEFEKFEFESQRDSQAGSVKGLGFGTPTSFR